MAGSTPTPSTVFGPLFAEVQERRLFGDGKLFADAVALADSARILADHAAAGPLDDAALRAFVLARFELPAPGSLAAAATGVPLRQRIAQLWDGLTREPVAARGSALALPYRHVVPGGRFREPYYWDSYFTMLGLARDRPYLVEALIDTFVGQIEAHGHVPNGARSYYVGRSQPPFFALMLDLSPQGATPRRLAAARTEYEWWMRERAVRMPDGSLLNRYTGGGESPRDESWAEDVAVAAESGRPEREVWRDLRAGAESGWDFSSRWFSTGGGLATIRTSQVVPVDLNALLYATERTLGLDDAADARRAAIDANLWHNRSYYADFDLETGPAEQLTAATLYPLFCGCASPAQADDVAETTGMFLVGSGGLRTTMVETGEQWDWPNGWAPLQWVAIAGLRRYGYPRLAEDIRRRWLATVERHYAATGQLFEKYDVETGTAGGGGEYAVQDGFGWTNGVTAALLDER